MSFWCPAKIGSALASWASVACMGSAGCSDSPRERTIAVFAASSLTDAFRELEREFEVAHPGTNVELTFAGSQVLRLQIEQGADADVFASANADHMQTLTDAGLVFDSAVFGQNELAVVVPLDNPAEIEDFTQLPLATRLVVGTPEVPVGRYTEELFHRAATKIGKAFEDRVRAHVVSKENNVRLVRAKIELGEADAAVVYRTDAMASDRLRSIPIPQALNIRVDYHMGRVQPSSAPKLGHRWMAHVRSPKGRQVLSRHGFVIDK